MILDESEQSVEDIAQQSKAFGKYFDECIDTLLKYWPGATDVQFRKLLDVQNDDLVTFYNEGKISERQAIQLLEHYRAGLAYTETYMGSIYTDPADAPENTRTLYGEDPGSVTTRPAFGLARAQLESFAPLFIIATLAEKIAVSGLPDQAGWVISEVKELNLVENTVRAIFGSAGLPRALADLLFILADELEERIRSRQEAQTAEEVINLAQSVASERIEELASLIDLINFNASYIETKARLTSLFYNLFNYITNNNNKFNQTLGKTRDKVGRHVNSSRIARMEEITTRAAEDYDLLKDFSKLKLLARLVGLLPIKKTTDIALRIIRKNVDATFRLGLTTSVGTYSNRLTNEYINAMDSLESDIS